MTFETSSPLQYSKLQSLLCQTKNARIGLIGDLCLDMYWVADMKQSKLSRETPHFPLPVVQERYAPGGAGNVACNIAALTPGSLQVLGAVGTVWRGDLLLKTLVAHKISTEYICAHPSLVTNTYIKPLRTGISDVIYEDPRLDFENRLPISPEVETQLLEKLDDLASSVDVLCVSDQMEYGCVTKSVRQKICDLGKQGLTVIVDSRDRACEYTHVILKPNEVEAAKLLDQHIHTPEDAADAAGKISLRTHKPAIITLGNQGSVFFNDATTIHCPACPVKPPVDFCGAGDTFLSGLGVFLASGADFLSAVQAATLCSAVTVKKIGTTGTASAEEITEAFLMYSE